MLVLASTETFLFAKSASKRYIKGRAVKMINPASSLIASLKSVCEERIFNKLL